MSDKTEEPIIDLPLKQKELEDLILNNLDDAWRMLQKDPAMVLALTHVKRNLEESENENAIEFLKTYNNHVNKIFQIENPLDRYGIALTTEFVTEYWRKSVATTKLTSIDKAISEKMTLLRQATEAMSESYEKTVTTKIVDYSSKRVLEFSGYNQGKARDHLFEIRPAIDDMIGDLLKENKFKKLLSLSYFATSPVESVEIMRNYIAKSLMLQIKPIFDDLDEDLKYKIAPYLGVFNQIVNQTDENQS